MNEQKSLLTRLGETLDQYRAERRGIAQERMPSGRAGWLHRLLPTPGNVIFTLVMIALLVAAQSVGAIPLRNTQYAAPSSTATIAYQGRLANAADEPLNGTYNMIFRLYDVATGGTPLWTEQWTGSNSVRVSDGLFNVMLGSLNAIRQQDIAGHDQLWLGITVGTDDEMQPRVQLGSVPFAVQALTVPDGSITTAKIANGAVTNANLASGAVERKNLAALTGIVWKTPPYVHYEHITWNPSENQTWDISSHLVNAGVPVDAEMILMGWRPSMISDVSGFDLLAADNTGLGHIVLSTNLPDLVWSPVGIEYGTPVAVPGQTRKVVYSNVGGYRQEQSDPARTRRVLIIYGWK